MNIQMKLCAALLGGALLIGCGEDTDDNKPTPTAPPPGSTPVSPQASSDASATATTDADGAAIKLDTDAAQAGAKQGTDALKAGAQDAANTAANDPAAVEASTQIQQVMTYIKDNKLELAETTLQQLEKNKASLPATIQPQVDQARQMLNAAKAKSGSGAAPALPAAPAPPPGQ